MDFVLGRKTHEIVIRGEKIRTGTSTRTSGDCIGLVKQRHPFKFAADVFGRMEVETDESNSESPMRTERYTLEVFSSTQGLSELSKLVEEWEQKYLDHVNA